MSQVLVIDDEPNVRFSIAEVLGQDGVEVLEAESADEGLRLAAEKSPDVILLDIRLEGISGLDVFRELRKVDPRRLVIFITGHGTSETAIEAMKLGAFDYLVKPLDAERLQALVKQAALIRRLTHVPALVDNSGWPDDTPDRLIGQCPAMQAVCKQIGRVAAQDVNVLILGESGTGKELVAKALYQHSRRSQAPFLAINCAAIPEGLLESELFGHERGAFTGADRRRIGKFEQCDGGTLFLDEVGDMAAGTQAKILRLLQEGEFERVGDSETRAADVRIIAATNQDLDGLIEAGRFRKDLYFRLRGVSLNLPPLRERREDIAELAHYFLFRINRQLGTMVQSISEEALEVLQNYRWPGNIRELQSVIRETLIASAGPTILPEFLPAEVRFEDVAESLVIDRSADLLNAVEAGDWASLPRLVDSSLASETKGLYRIVLDELDRLLISRVLRETGGKQSDAAEVLGISRPTLRLKLRNLKLSIRKAIADSTGD